MNIEAYNLDSLRKLVRSLQEENRKLKTSWRRRILLMRLKTYLKRRLKILRNMILTRAGKYKANILQRNLRISTSQCFGEERMYMRKEAQRAVIFRSVITDGIINLPEAAWRKNQL